MEFVYKLKHNGVIVKESTDDVEFFQGIYSMMENGTLLEGSTFTTNITDGFTQGTWFIVYCIDRYNFGVQTVEFTKTVEEALNSATKVHYGPDCNSSYIYQLEFDGESEVTIVKKLNTRKVTTVELV